jgi:hypothetical protein
MEDIRIHKFIHDIDNVVCACSGYVQLVLNEEDRNQQIKLLNNHFICIDRLVDLLEEFSAELSPKNKDLQAINPQELKPHRYR